MRALFPSLLCVWLGLLSSGSVAARKDDVSSSLIPNPLAPPSKEFCQSNSLGDSTYVSLIQPCVFKFYSTEAAPDDFSCGAYESSTVIKLQERAVLLWPDFCVAAGPRCYSLPNYPDLANYTIYQDSQFSMEFPSNANVVSVDCTADFAAEQELVDSVTNGLNDIAAAVIFCAWVLLFAIIAGIVVCLACCCGACGPRRGSTTPVQQPYHNVPGSVWKGEPVRGTVFMANPSSKGTSIEMV